MKLPAALKSPALLALNFLAVVLLAAGGVRLYVPDLEPLAAMPYDLAWVCAGLGLACLGLFWVLLLGKLRAARLPG